MQGSTIKEQTLEKKLQLILLQQPQPHSTFKQSSFGYITPLQYFIHVFSHSEVFSPSQTMFVTISIALLGFKHLWAVQAGRRPVPIPAASSLTSLD